VSFSDIVLFQELLKQQDLEKRDYLSYMQVLEKEMSGLSSCSLAKESEILRKDVEKTRAKLKETEFKFKNAIQEKTKLEVDIIAFFFIFLMV
jgi:centromeric protein E